VGTVVLNLGPVGGRLLSALSGALPGEQFVDAADADPATAEVVATLGFNVGPLAPLLTEGVRWVHVLGAGIDGVPLDVIGARTVTCSRGASAVPIAEFVLAHMLAFEKHIPSIWIDAPAPEEQPTTALGTLRQRTLGLIGVGAIGTEVAKRALAFDMRVLVLRKRAGAPLLEGVEVVSSRDDLLGQSDHVVIAAPATAETYHLMDDAAFAACRPGVHLVNIARGTLVDQEALLRALDAGQVGAASLDVVEPEVLPAGHPLYRHPRVRLTPHIAWSSPDTIARTIEIFVDNIRRFRAGQPLAGEVSRQLGY
jgi:phosphoglycerate dehydrogenase-like enzyme